MRMSILLVDNDPDFLNTRAEFLKNAGYRVLKATTLAQAEQFLQDAHVYLAILDIRMVNDDDEKDVSGLTLAKNPAYQTIPKIMLTSFPGYEHTREAMGPALDGLPPAVDFLSKPEGPEAMIQAVERAFSQHVRINLDLRIRLGGLLSFSGIAEIVEARLQDGAVLLDRAGEMEDLFRKLFYTFTEVIISPIGQGRRGALVVQALPSSATGTERQLVVKCGQHDTISREKENYEQWVKKYVGALSTQIAGFEETSHFAAIAYAIVGGQLEETKRFAEFYQESDEPVICTALDYLFKETCKLWYEQKSQQVEDKSLSILYREQLELGEVARGEKDLREVVEYIRNYARSLDLSEIRRVPAGDPQNVATLTFSFVDGSAASGLDPALHVYHDPKVFGPPALLGITHGDLNGDNVRVARDGRIWLTDFERAGWGPVLRDLVQLETVIKFDMTKTIKLPDLSHLEQRLLTPYHFADSIRVDDTIPGDLRKATGVIKHLRKIAGEVTGSDMQQYYLGLLFHAVQVMLGKGSLPSFGLNRPEYARKAHALLSAAMIAQKLAEWSEQKAAESRQQIPSVPTSKISTKPIYIDPGGDVWVEGEKLEPNLSPLEFALLSHFCSKPGVLCTRDEIIEVLYPGSDPGDISDDAINSVVERLRKRIERGRKPPKYIVTVRGRGYKLADL